MDGLVRPSGYGTGGISHELWRTCPRAAIMNDNNLGYFVRDDFTALNAQASATPQNGLVTYQDTGVTVSGLATAAGGVLRIAGADADNDEGSVQIGGVSPPFILSTTAPRKLWFEARVRQVTIVDQALFIGLAPTASAVADILVNDTGALKNQAMLGFRILTADPDGLDAVYKLSSTETVVKESALDITANTWFTCGFYFDGTLLHYYVNGVRVNATGVPLGGSTFPDDTYMSPLFAIKAGEGVEKIADIDWVECFQLR